MVGVFIKVWHPDWLKCNWEQERLDAMRVAAKLGIPFLTCDAEEAYRQGVADYFISEYQAGHTPNPDVMCNQQVKFGRFLEFALENGAERIATGHYARIDTHEDKLRLLRGLDANKDQSYFLWTLTDYQLQHILFPVGDTPKSVIREEAHAAGLPTAAKDDSQGICFLGHIDMYEFLRHYTTLTPGPVKDTSGKIVGEHKGALIYTLGQRHGFSITTVTPERAKHYVVEKDIETNTIVVDASPPKLRSSDTLTIENLVLREELSVGDECQAQTRYRQQPFAVTVSAVTSESIELTPTDSTERPAAGQSCVLYRGDVCIGGGIIQGCKL